MTKAGSVVTRTNYPGRKQGPVLSEPSVFTVSGDWSLTDPGQPLRYDIVFEPLRSFPMHFELVVNKQSGGRWHFDVQLDATEPDVDEITIEAMLNRTSSVSFKLTNQITEK